VQELLHDGHPTACVGDAAFAYVNAFTAHVNVGFFHGAALSDPSGLLEGTGRFMRHVKLRPGGEVDVAGLLRLINVAYGDMKRRLETEESGQSLAKDRLVGAQWHSDREHRRITGPCTRGRARSKGSS